MKIVLTKLEENIYKNMPTGEDNAIHAEKFAADIGVSERELRRVVKAMREKGVLICSCCDKDGGYFLPASDNEISAYLGRQLSRLGHIWKALAPFKNHIKNLPLSGQIALDELIERG